MSAPRRVSSRVRNLVRPAESQTAPCSRPAMSDPPIVFKRTKSKAASRARATDEPPAASALSAGDAEPELSTAALAAKVKNKAKQRNKPKKNLSFGAEEEVRL